MVGKDKLDELANDLGRQVIRKFRGRLITAEACIEMERWLADYLVQHYPHERRVPRVEIEVDADDRPTGRARIILDYPAR
jgi:hypothetical protein